MNEMSDEDFQNLSKSDFGSELEKIAMSVENLENLLALQGETYLDETFDDLKKAALNESDIPSEGLNHSSSETNLNDSLEHNTSGLSSHRTLEMLLYLQNRSLSLGTMPNVDEWENDDDNGLVVINISKDEFVEFDQAARMNLASRSKTTTPSMDQNGHSRTVASPANNAGASSSSSSSAPTADVSSLAVSSSSTEKGTKTEGDEADDVSPALESEDLNVSLGGGSKDVQPTPKFTPNSKPAGSNPGSSSRTMAGHFGRPDIMGQQAFRGVDGQRTCFFNLKVIFEPFRTGFEESKELSLPKGAIIAGRYQVSEVLGSAAFSTALQCVDLMAEEDEAQWVCLKVIKNNKDFFDQSLDEIKLLQYINSCGDPDANHVLRLYDFFYCKEHLFIVTELLKENLYEFGRFIREHDHEPYYIIPRLKRIMHQVLSALAFIHSLNLIHCDIKPENIVIKSFSRCEVKLIDFGSSCFTSDHLTNYIQSRSYRAPEVILGLPYDHRIDVWSIAAVLAELHTGYVLFQNDSVVMMLSRITGILGPFPKRVLDEGKEVHKYFTRTNIVYERDEDNRFSMIFPKKTCLQARLHLPLSDLTPDEALFVDFIQQMLHLDPQLRLTAAEALQHPWLADAETVYFEEYVIGQPASHSSSSSGAHHQRQGSYVPGAAPYEEQEDDADDGVLLGGENDDEDEEEEQQEEDEDAEVLIGDVVDLDDDLEEYESAEEGEELEDEAQAEDSGDSEFERAAALCVDSLDEEDEQEQPHVESEREAVEEDVAAAAETANEATVEIGADAETAEEDDHNKTSDVKIDEVKGEEEEEEEKIKAIE